MCSVPVIQSELRLIMNRVLILSGAASATQANFWFRDAAVFTPPGWQATDPTLTLTIAFRVR